MCAVMGSMMGGWMMSPWMWIWMIGWWLIVVGVLVAAGYLVLRLVRGGAGPVSTGPGSALDILDRRYAAGEISSDEYRRMRQELERR